MTGGIVVGSLGISEELLVKPATTTRNNTDVLAADPDLQFTAVANGIYWIFLNAFLQVRAASDFKYQFTNPGGGAAMTAPTGNAVEVGWTTGQAITNGVDLFNPRTILQTAGVGSLIWCPAAANLIMGGSGGTVALEWAQNAAVAENTSILIGSSMLVRRVL